MTASASLSTAARLMAGYDTAFIGAGNPGRAALLAQQLNPDLTVFFESGIIGARLTAAPRSISDSRIAAGARLVVPQEDMFDCWMSSRRIDVAIVGAAQVDRKGNVNTTVIGPYRRPQIRFPGGGGAADLRPRKAMIVLLGDAGQRLVDAVDFVTYRLPVELERWIVADEFTLHAAPGDDELADAVAPLRAHA